MTIKKDRPFPSGNGYSYFPKHDKNKARSSINQRKSGPYGITFNGAQRETRKPGRRRNVRS